MDTTQKARHTHTHTHVQTRQYTIRPVFTHTTLLHGIKLFHSQKAMIHLLSYQKHSQIFTITGANLFYVF